MLPEEMADNTGFKDCFLFAQEMELSYERFHMAFAVYGVDANRCHCQVLLRQ
jgi:hypothetical protein